MQTFVSFLIIRKLQHSNHHYFYGYSWLYSDNCLYRSGDCCDMYETESFKKSSVSNIMTDNSWKSIATAIFYYTVELQAKMKVS